MRLSWIPAALLLGGLLPAQLRPAPPPPRPAPMPPRAVPTVAPPVDHPVYAGQPGRGDGQQPTPPSPGQGQGGPGGPDDPTREEVEAREFRAVKVAGKELRRKVKELRELEWVGDLERAEARSAATGRPIFWVQALGDLTGFA